MDRFVVGGFNRVRAQQVLKNCWSAARAPATSPAGPCPKPVPARARGAPGCQRARTAFTCSGVIARLGLLRGQHGAGPDRSAGQRPGGLREVFCRTATNFFRVRGDGRPQQAGLRMHDGAPVSHGNRPTAQGRRSGGGVIIRFVNLPSLAWFWPQSAWSIGDIGTSVLYARQGGFRLRPFYRSDQANIYGILSDFSGR
jgi:hypothetical protein